MATDAEAFVDEETETSFLREIVYWSTTGGYDIVGELHLTEERDIFTSFRSMAWSGLLYSYDHTGKVDVGTILGSIPTQSAKAEIITWLLADSQYGSKAFVPWGDMLEKLRVLASCRLVNSTTMMTTQLKTSPGTVREVAYQMCTELERVVLSNVKTDDVGSDFDSYSDIMRKGGTWLTGINQLDCHGRFGGYYGIIAARSHHGKTAAIVSMMLNQLLNGYSVFLWQGEQTKAQMYLRFVCQMTCLKSWDVLRNRDPEHQTVIKKARAKIDQWLRREPGSPALYLYDGRMTVFDVMRRIRAARQKHPICVAYIDQLSKFQRDLKSSREAAYSDISEVLAYEAGRLQQPILMAHQLNIKERKDAAGPPAFWQVKDCGRLYEDCDVWITVDRPEVDAERMVEFDKAREKYKAKGLLDDADRFDVRGRVKIKVEKDRVATFGCHEEWLGFDHDCGRLFSRFNGPDALHFATREVQQNLAATTESVPNDWV